MMTRERIAEIFDNSEISKIWARNGAEKGHEEGREEMLRLLLEQRFGVSAEEAAKVAHTLADSLDSSSALKAVLEADDLAGLVQTLPSD